MRNITVLLFEQEVLNLQWPQCYCEVVPQKCMNLKVLLGEASYLEVNPKFLLGSGDLKTILACFRPSTSSLVHSLPAMVS